MPWRAVAIATMGVGLLSCRSGSTGPTPTTTGALRITVLGVPAGATPAITVAGPNGYQTVVNATTTLTQLLPGSYHAEAPAIEAGGDNLTAAPASQDVTVVGDTTVDAVVTYTNVAGGSLVITVGGLPSDTAPTLQVTGSGYSATAIGNTTLGPLFDGSYTISAPPITDGGVTYQPVPASQTVSIAGAQVSVSIQYLLPTSALTIAIDGLYINQAAQTYGFDVPLVRDRPGFLRVFLRANQANAVTPDVRVRFYAGGQVILTDTIPAHHAGVPQSINEADTTASWNLSLPPMLLEPGVQLLVDVDPSATIPLATRSGLTYPGTGVPGTLDIRTAGSYNLTFVPVLNTADGRTGDATAADYADFLRAVRLLHPMWLYTAGVHATFTFSGGVFQPSDQNGAIANLLQQIELLRLSESSSNYYYGVMHLPYTSGQVGLGYINTAAPTSRSAVGWDARASNPLADGSETYAHELGHNMGLFHAPCGGASNPDPNYPHPGGQVGVYGYNVNTGVMTGLSNFDMMGYCTPIWISDYSYGRLITLAPLLGSQATGDRAPPVHVYLISGSIRDGVVTLNPALEATAQPVLPPMPGPWRVTGYGATGTTLFSNTFAPTPVADVASGSLQQFAFAIPLDSTAALARIEVIGPGAEVSLGPAAVAALSSDTVVVRATRVNGDDVELTWSSIAYPLLMVRNAVSGDVLAFGRGGDVLVRSGSAPLAITASDGVRSRVVRVAP